MLLLDENPPMVPEGVGSLAEIEGEWWVAHTRSRAEKSFARDLLAHRIAYFLPMQERVQVWGGRRRKVLIPIFQSYVFFAGSAEARQSALATQRIAHVFPVRQREKFVAELQAIQLAVQSGAMLDPFPSIAVGSRCRVVRGPLRGIEGIVIRKDGVTKLVLQIRMLGQGACLEIGPEDLELTA
jgi:transcription antitermination factor NusG